MLMSVIGIKDFVASLDMLKFNQELSIDVRLRFVLYGIPVGTYVVIHFVFSGQRVSDRAVLMV